MCAARDARERERLQRIEVDFRGAVLQQVLRDRKVIGSQCLFVRCSSGTEAAGVYVHAALDQELYALEEVVLSAGAQLDHQHTGGIDQRVVHTLDPPAAFLLSETMGEQEREVIVVLFEVAVVESLSIVWVRTRLEEHRRKAFALRMRRLIRPVLASTERPRQSREGVAPRMQKAGIGIRAAREEQAGDFKCGVIRIGRLKARVARIKQRLPMEGTAFRVHEPGVAVEDRSHASDVAGRGGGVDVRTCERRMIGQHPTGPGRIRWMPAGVCQTREPDEHVDERFRIRRRRWIPHEGLDFDEMLLEPGPTRKPVRARRYQLRIRERKPAHRTVWARMKLLHARDRVGIARQHRAAQPLGVFTQMVEGVVVRKRTCRHSDLLARVGRAGGLWSAASGEEAACLSFVDVRAGLALSADWERPVRLAHCSRPARKVGKSKVERSKYTPRPEAA